MPKTYVVHLGNSKELMKVAEGETYALREHVRHQDFNVGKEDLLFALINSKPFSIYNIVPMLIFICTYSLQKQLPFFVSSY
jgi:hypothetical protein